MITIENEDSKVFLFGRNGNEPTVEIIDDFLPYFYVSHPDGAYKTIEGKRAKRLVFKIPSQVGKEREKYKESYESDIVYTNRYIIDRLPPQKKENIRICYFDVEIARTEKGYEAPELANNKLLSVCCYDSYNKEYKQFCLNKTHTDEKEMLRDFIDYVNKTDPDMFVAWNGDGFDFPYIVNRMKKLKLDDRKFARLERRCKVIMARDHICRTRVFGRVCFDLMQGYKKIAQGGRNSWALDYISKYEGLGGKEEYKGELDDLFNKDIDKFIEYNKRDVELLVLLNEKLGITDFFDETRRLCSCKIDDVFMNSKMADSLCLKWAKGKCVLPKSRDNPKEPYLGGFVHDSDPKLHKNIAVMDMKSLYPSIIIGFNVSYETFLKSKEEGCINIDNKYFYKNEPGIIPAIVKPMLKRRKTIKDTMKQHNPSSQEYKSMDMTQYALKVIANSFYGVLGHRHFRLYRREAAESITYTAQKIIKEVHKWFEDKGYKVVYGDTDSVFIDMGKDSIEKFISFNAEINEHFKTRFKEFGVKDENNIFKLEFEKIYKTVFFKKKDDGTGAKKRYAGRVIWKDGKDVDEFSVVGFESRRSDSPDVGRTFMSDILRMIVYEKPKEEIDAFIEKFKKDIKEEFTPEQIGLPMGISKSFASYKNKPIHVRASLLANEKHSAQIKQGDKIKYIFVKDINNVIAWKSEKYMPAGYEVDHDQMIRRIVDLKVGPLYHSLGWEYAYIEFKKPKKDKRFKFMDTLKQEGLW